LEKLPRRAQVFELLGSFPRALHLAEIASRLGVSDSNHGALARILEDLTFDGSIVAMAGHRYRASKVGRERATGAIREGFLSVNPRGFGFVPMEGDGEDLFIPAESMAGAMHGDKVRVKVVARSSRGAEGAVLDVVERRAKRIAGALSKKGRALWVTPEDGRVRGPIVIARSELAEGANHGDVVIVVVTRYPESPDENPEGELVAVLGKPGDPQVEVQKILALASVEEAHPPLAVTEAKAFPREVPPETLTGLEDLTAFPLPTIDPEDARDHDDALWAERLPEGGYRVLVAIADVSAYVTAGSALDDAARERGCSIYLPDRAIPMLPRELSSHLCSLLPDVTRLCLAVDLELDATGETRSYRLIEGFMRSQAKLTYEQVALTLGLTREGQRSPKAEELKTGLALLREISSLLRARRMRRGALDFDLPETKIVVDPETHLPVSASRRGKDPGVAKAYQIVEELMLLANETVAAFLIDQQAPGIFRNHGAPDPEKVARFAALCTKFGVEMDPDDALDPKKLSAFVRKLRETEGSSILDTFLVRTLKQAVYDVANIGHFGLASPAYLHFTSPIRRYPDLVVHRVVRGILRRGPIDRTEGGVQRMRESAVLASERERRAMQVERDVVDLHGALLMREMIGDLFIGTVTGIVGSGVFVTLEDPFVSVLVKLEALGRDDYEPDDDGFAVIGKRSGDRVELGERIHVEIVEVSLDRRTTYGRRIFEVGQEARTESSAKKQRQSKKSARASEPPRGGRGKRGSPVGARKAQRKRSR
jgi:ribonuclease R